MNLFFSISKVGPNRRMSTGMNASQSQRFPRSGSDQHLPRVDYSDFASLNRHSLLRVNIIVNHIEQKLS